MKLFFKILIVNLIGFPTSYIVITDINHESDSGNVIELFFKSVTLLILFVIAFFDKKEFNRTKKWKSFITTTILSVIVICHVVLEQNFKITDNSPSQFYCKTIGETDEASIDFRKDGTYKYWGHDIYRGYYKIENNIITIDKPKIEYSVESNRFLIKQNGVFDSLGKQEKSIFQIDKKGAIISYSTDFKIIENNDKH